ncbi:hypothetical protein J2X14_002146 [Pantoea alhagi]|uniref:IpaD/SipD/SspD family type III secretion system needle tip protein n=1 Tax=Mixta sp. BE291 TaxID=3158787 RepID=UPI002863303F|nr:hypothetical protein [Pantoea alhagi]
MTQILPGYTSAIKGMSLAPLSKEKDAMSFNSEDSDLQQPLEQAKERVVDDGKKNNGSSPTLQNRVGLLQALVELKQGGIPVSDENYNEVSENLNYSLAQKKHYVSNYMNSEERSDIEIQQQIQSIVNGTQKEFMDPFMTASQKMTDYYNDISNLRNLLSGNIKPDPDDKDNKGTLVINSTIYIGIKDFLKKWGGSALYPTAGLGVSKDEAQDWCAKMGVGKVEYAGSGKYKVIIEKTPLEDILKVFEDYKAIDANFVTVRKISQTVYNNLMASVDTFLQKEQGKMNKIVNQLDYYNKLISQLQERLSEFSKQMADVALNFLRV